MERQLWADGYDVMDYDTELQVEPSTGKLFGSVAVLVRSQGDWSRPLVLSAEGLSIESVREGSGPLEYKHEGSSLQVLFPPGGEGSAPRRVDVRYHGQPTKGLKVHGGVVYTFFHTGRWMPSRDVPGDKATWTLRLTLPAGLNVVASGVARSVEPLPGGLERHTWRLDVPYSTYLFGFVAGRFQEARAEVDGVGLRYLAADRSEDELRRIFADTVPMWRFFRERAGTDYPLKQYTQVLADEAPAQEMAGLALLTADFADEVLAEPREDWLIAHELAHQWWGNLVTCGHWSDFWLNEGMTTFMTAAYKEQRWGRDEYDREMVLARRRYLRARTQGADRPLSLAESARSAEVGGPLPYVKGSLVLNLLRYQVGERAFWEGLHGFTSSHAYCWASSESLRSAMERASGQDLGGFFTQWVKGSAVPDIAVQHRLEGDDLVVDVEQRQQEAWTLPLVLAIETESGRAVHPVQLNQRHQQFHFPVSGPLKSVRADSGGVLPFALSHERPARMLLHQLEHEPDVQGRVDALESLSALCGGGQPPAECQALASLLSARAEKDSSRLMRKLAKEALQQLGAGK